jgi:circadian clock protein KaiC
MTAKGFAMSPDNPDFRQLERLPSGIPGFDGITDGGLPAGSVTLVAGTTGSGKTVLAMQFLAAGILAFDQPGVFVTLAESPEKLRRFVGEFGWPVAGWEEKGRFAFVDATTDVRVLVVGDNFDFGVLLDRIAAAVERVGARRVVVDSIDVLLERYGDRTAVRHGMEQISVGLERLGVTALLTVGRGDDHGQITASGVEEFIADNVVILRNSLVADVRRRTVSVLKVRGTHHHRGEYPFGIIRGEGIVVIPLVPTAGLPAADQRISTGNLELDEMCGGGLFQDAVTLVSGSTGIGKTTLALRFVLAGIETGRTAVFVGYEESRHQLLRGFRSWGVDFEQLEADGKLRMLCDAPEAMAFDEHLIRIKRTIDEIGADRVAIDSLGTLERAAPERVFREYLVGLTAHIKDQKIAGVLTTTSSALSGSPPAADRHVSALSDAIILLRYAELDGEIRRCLSVLKLRGSDHEKRIREFTLGPDGLTIGGLLPTRGTLTPGATRVTGMLSEEPNPPPPCLINRRGAVPCTCRSDCDAPKLAVLASGLHAKVGRLGPVRSSRSCG